MNGLIGWAALAAAVLAAAAAKAQTPLYDQQESDYVLATGLPTDDRSSLEPSGSADAAAPLPDYAGLSLDAPQAGLPLAGSYPHTEGPLRRWAEREPFKLPQPAALEAMGVHTGGWFQGGITLNGEDPQDRQNGPVCANDRAGEFQMHQLWLYFDRPTDTQGYGFDLGGRIDMFYGTDWRIADVHASGLEDEINNEDNFYGLSLPQFYVEGAVNNLSVKVGHMAGILGYEIVPAIGNFFYSHSYALCYSEPILITGAMGRYKITDRLSALAGVHRGFGQFEDNNDNANFQSGLMWNDADSGVALAYAFDAGTNDPAGLEDQYVHSLVFKYQLTEKTLYVLQNDLGYTDRESGADDAQWYGINQYLLYTLSEKWGAGIRAEWFRDDDGTRVGGLGNFNRGWLGPGGYEGDFTELTAGLNWRPKANLIFRPELRWDHYNGRPSVAGGGAYALPFDDGNSREQFTLATDMVLSY